MRRTAMAVFLILLAMEPLFSSVFKGQREYMKKCKVCHGGGAKMAKSKTSQEWIKIFKNKGAVLVKAHENSKRIYNYFKSENFSKKSSHLRDFFVKYAYDSGNVPACSD